MPHQSDPRFLVLHGSKLKGFAESSSIAAMIGLKPKVVEKHLADLAKHGFAMHRDGRIAGWMLTPEGRTEHGSMLAADVEAMGAFDAIQGHYEEFLEWNRELLTVCTAWQIRSQWLGNRFKLADYLAVLVTSS